jgi:hypothetical protein
VRERVTLRGTNKLDVDAILRFAPDRAVGNVGKIGKKMSDACR